MIDIEISDDGGGSGNNGGPPTSLTNDGNRQGGEAPNFDPHVRINNNTQEEQQVENILVRTLGREPINNREVLITLPRTLVVLWKE